MKHISIPTSTFIIILVGTLLTGAFDPVTAQQTVDETVLAIVNEDTITAQQLMVELGRIHAGKHDTSRSDFSVDKIMEKLVNDRLLIQDARLLQMDQEPDFLRLVSTYRARAAVDQFITDVLPDTFSVPEEEIRNYYQDQYRLVHLYRLVLRDQLQADSLMRALRQGSSLEAEAAKYATEMYRYGGGDLGFKRWSSFDPSIQDQLQSLKPGEMKGPFPYRNSLAVIRLIEIKPADSVEFGKFKGSITALLKQRKKEGYRQSYIERLKQKYPIVVNDSLLQAMVIARDSTQISDNQTENVVATVGAESITAKTLNNKVLHRSAGMTPEMTANLKQEVLEELIQNKLFKLEAVTNHYEANLKVIATTDEFADSLLLMNYINQILDPQIKVTPAALDSFYAANKAQFHKPDQVKISQITNATEDSSRQVLKRLKEGADFAWLAEKFSLDDAATKGGEKGWFELDIFPPSIRDQLATLPPGEVIGPFQSMEGLVILKILEHKPGEILELSAVRSRIEQVLSQVEFNRIIDKTLAELKADAQITIHHEALKSIILGATRSP